MTKLLLLCLLTVSVSEAITRKVCALGIIGIMNDGTQCQYSTINDAIAASSPGDLILTKAGDALGVPTIKSGIHDLTFKSDAIDQFPRDTRIDKGIFMPQTQYLTKLTGMMVIGGEQLAGTITIGSAILNTSPTSPATNPGLAVGDKLVVGSKIFTPFYCADPPATILTTPTNFCP